ncbi:MAG: sugar phosphate isomerase/epimerase family protein [Chloroflexota bacterium]
MIDFGIHPFIWTSSWNHESVHLIERAQHIGFQALDIPVRTLDDRDIHATRTKLDALSMRVVAVAGVGEPYNLISDEESVRQTTVRYLKKLVRNTHAIGGNILAGPYYASMGTLVGRGPTDEELEHSAHGLKEVARFAMDLGVKLALEPLNRYETYLINTSEQGLRMIERIGEPNVGLQLDTYQMNIEEKDFYAAIINAGDRLFHCHVCENDRGIPGTGLVRWDRVFQALRDINYQGAVSIESFVSSIPEIAAATCIWRSLAPDGDTLAREGLTFLRSMAQKYGLAE